MNTSERLNRNPRLSVTVHITEAVRSYKLELMKVVVTGKSEENSHE